MAKSLRASVKKANKSKLRSNVFARVEDARNERLSAKLLELASKPKEVDMKEDTTTETPSADVLPEGDAVPEDETTVDSKITVDEPKQSKGKARAGARGIRKKSRKSIVFPVGRKEYKPRNQLQRRKR